MSDTLNALFVLFFFLLPGIAGNAIYTKVTGTSSREEPWRNIARILGISLGGLILYVLVGSLLNAPLPGYSLDTLDTFALTKSRLRPDVVRVSGAFDRRTDRRLRSLLHLVPHSASKDATAAAVGVERRGDEHEAAHAVMDCLGEIVWAAQRTGSPLPPAEMTARYLDCLARKASAD